MLVFLFYIQEGRERDYPDTWIIEEINKTVKEAIRKASL
jgi:hypothetical protein